MGSEMLITWGPERTSRVNPLDEWLAAGAALAAGTDLVRPFNPMTTVWGMVTRGTKSAGIQDPEHVRSTRSPRIRTTCMTSRPRSPWSAVSLATTPASGWLGDLTYLRSLAASQRLT